MTAPMQNPGTASHDQRTLSRLIKALQQTRRRHLPYGLLSLRFLFPTSNPWIRLHRELRLSTSPVWRVFFTVANVWLTLHWLTWSAWRASNNAVRSHGPAAHAAGAQSPPAQRREILRLALLHSLPPLAWYQYQLWQPSKNIWAYVYDSELPQFHQFYNGNLKGKSARLLADKWLFAQTATAHGIAATPSLAELKSGQHDALLELFQYHTAVFCKPRFGSASFGAFTAMQQNGVLKVKLLKDDAALQDKAATHAIKELLARHDYVVQPLLENHALLQALCDPTTHGVAESISVRVLSRHWQNRFDLFCAYLEIPRHENDRKLHALIKINCESGALQGEGDNWHYRQLRQRSPRTLTAAQRVTAPYWSQIRDHALAAHRLTDEINIVAWDFIVTNEGAVLLEGNINWRVAPVQILFGPLLPRLFPQ